MLCYSKRAGPENLSDESSTYDRESRVIRSRVGAGGPSIGGCGPLVDDPDRVGLRTVPGAAVPIPDHPHLVGSMRRPTCGPENIFWLADNVIATVVITVQVPSGGRRAMGPVALLS